MSDTGLSTPEEEAQEDPVDRELASRLSGLSSSESGEDGQSQEAAGLDDAPASDPEPQPSGAAQDGSSVYDEGAAPALNTRRRRALALQRGQPVGHIGWRAK